MGYAPRKKYINPKNGQLESARSIAKDFGISGPSVANKIRYGKSVDSADSIETVYHRTYKQKAKEEMQKLIAELDARKAEMNKGTE